MRGSNSDTPGREDVAPTYGPLTDELARQGAWLFRWRSYLPLPLLIALMAWVYLRPPLDQHAFAHWGWEVLCLGVGFAGLAVRLWVAGLVPRGTSGRNTHKQVADALNTSGPYALARHPLYIGNFLMWLAAALYSRSAAWVLVTGIYFWGCYERIMVTEERFLLARFGDAFREWAAATPAVIPAWSHWKAPDMDYSWRTAVRREYAGMFGLVATLGALELAEQVGISGRLRMDPWWQALLAGSAVLYILVRTLSRRTRLLDVSGR